MTTPLDTLIPQPIRVGVQGFVATTSGAKPPAAAPIDWMRLKDLPAFQMFAAERGGKVRETEDDYAAYCAWHTAKGYWPEETPMGRLKGGGL